MVTEEQNNAITSMEDSLLKTINRSKSFKIWISFLVAAFIFCMYFYYIQIRDGLGVTGLNDFVSWGIYISNFVFFVAASLVGMLISSVLGLTGSHWVKPIARIAEIIAVAFAMVAGLIIIVDMGRPDRLLNVFLHGRIQSPIVWDVFVVITYLVISILLLFIPMIPDMHLCSERLTGLPKWQIKMYKILSFGWNNKPEQFLLIKKYTQILLVLIIPIALAIHTVTSWLFAMTLRAGWDSPIFGPYFVSGAFVAGSAAVIIAMFFFQKNYKIKEYITDKHFDNMGKLLVLVALVYVYFNINEIIVPAYKLKTSDSEHLQSILFGHDSVMFWLVQLGGLVIPFILLLFKAMRRPAIIATISMVILLGAWFKRYLIVVPIQQHPYFPIQNVPDSFKYYHPTFAEIAITSASFILVLIIITILSKFFPVVPIWELREDMDKQTNK